MKTITTSMLLTHHACLDQVDLFVATFGESMAITKTNWTKAQKVGLNVLWASCLLPASAWAEYDKVRAKVRASASAEYYKVCASALAEYDKVRVPALFAALRASP